MTKWNTGRSKYQSDGEQLAGLMYAHRVS